MKPVFCRSHMRLLVFTSVPCLLSSAAFATNGMLMEGYGPESTGMGGVATAIHNGNAGMANNPATLTQMADGESRLDVSIGNLRPAVDAAFAAMPAIPVAESGGDSYIMPAAGWVRKTGQFSYGVGVYSQGGMGTEYDKNSFLGSGTGVGARSEVGIGSVIVPVAYEVSPALSIGGTVEYVWGGLDMQMGMPIMNANGPTAGSFADFSTGFGGAQVLGSASGNLLDSMAPMLMGMTPAQMQGTSAVFDFSNSSDFTGQADGSGIGARIGATYKATPQLTLGASYRTKTNMSDLKGDGSMKLVDMASGTALPSATIPGKYTIRDFQFPDVASIGMAYQLNERTTFGLDYSRINWSGVMDQFRLSFTADSNVPGLGGQSVDVALKQQWKDQNVIKLGVAHKVNDRLTVRAGANLARNPVPDAYLNPLFPAIVENHFTTGFTYGLSKQSDLSASLAIAPEVEQTNSNTGIQSTHSQTNFQLMYSQRF
ncbi:MAG TPA: outer membrane protein transport protein [Thiolinea sp.]|nr:outer membrane protein transport protein [Thiolinea sp.]